jgi:hypothetical protein
LIVSVVIFTLLLLSFGFRFHNNTVSLGNTSAVVKVFAYLLAAMPVLYSASYLDPARASRLATTFNAQALITDPRAFEILDFFASSGLSQLVIGRGVGGSVRSSIYGGEQTQTMHVGIMNVWLKFGVISFVVTAVVLLGVVPAKYFRSRKRVRESVGGRSYEDVANVIVLPALFPWIVLLVLSGGFDEASFMLLGATIFLYGVVRRLGSSVLTGRGIHRHG